MVRPFRYVPRKSCHMMRATIRALFVLHALCCTNTTRHGSLFDSFCHDTYRTSVLSRLPLNDGVNCLGIAVAVEAIAERGETARDDCDNIHELAEKLFHTLGSSEPLTLPRYVVSNGSQIAIDDDRTLSELSRLITQRYRRHCFRALQLPVSRGRLDDSFRHSTESVAELESILDADPDQLVVMCGTGKRYFPNGNSRDSCHAFLLSRLRTGKIVVYDSNDPSGSHTCEITESDTGVVISWTCLYRNQKLRTTQRYQVSPRSDYFRGFFEPTDGKLAP